MMSVIEYAQDINMDVEVVLKKAQELGYAQNKEDMLSEECVGFYSGEPNEKDTETFKGSLIATYSM